MTFQTMLAGVKFSITGTQNFHEQVYKVMNKKNRQLPLGLTRAESPNADYNNICTCSNLQGVQKDTDSGSNKFYVTVISNPDPDLP